MAKLRVARRSPHKSLAAAAAPPINVSAGGEH